MKGLLAKVWSLKTIRLSGRRLTIVGKKRWLKEGFFDPRGPEGFVSALQHLLALAGGDSANEAECISGLFVMR
jgi:hypothetical protein